jgi:HK97 family phage major capsid protein
MRHRFLAAACVAALLPSGAIFADAGPAEARLVALESELQELQLASETITNLADQEDRDLTEAEITSIEANATKMEGIQRQINARKAAVRAQAGAGRRSTPEPQNRTTPAGGGGRVIVNGTDAARHGFRSFGQFAQAVRNHYAAANGGGTVDDQVTRLRNAATTYGNEGVGADGGFLVPPSFSTEIWQKVQAEENLLNRCTPLITDGNSMMIPKDETTPWQTTGGVQVYWEGEAQAPAASKPAFEMGALRLAKLMALVPISDELLSDASGLESWLRAKAPGKMVAKINTAIIAGTGVGQPLGIIPGGAAVGASVIQVSKETSQPADTLWMSNIEKMYSRMYAGWRRNGIWLINQDLEPQLSMMAFQAAGASSMLPGTNPVPAYLPPGGLSTSPYGTLKGRPVVPVEACSAIGDLGDIIFADFNQYWALTKAGGIQTDTSIHLFFDQALTAFRFIFRLNGQPAWSSTITRQNGGNTLSWATTLQAR